MNGSSLPSPELPLPQSNPESGSESNEAGSVEKKVVSNDAVSQQGPTTPMPMVDPSKFASGTGQPQTSTMSQDDPANGADDADVIEKEWVTRAKAIVERTKDNPNQQSRELSNFKAEYIKKRFNKDLKVAKEAVKES